MKPEYQEYKERLFSIILGDNHHDELLNLIDQLHDNGASKNDIYDIFLNFHIEIQKDNRTKTSERIYDALSDFMDGFTDFGQGFKILPNEKIK